MNPETPHCVDKSRFDFGNLDWDAAWKALFFMPLERKAIDLCSSWKAAHGVLYTAHRLVLFGRLDVSLACFCGHPIETTERPFFIILRRRVVWFVLCSYLFLSSPMAPSISDRHVHFGFNDDEFFLLCFLEKHATGNDRKIQKVSTLLTLRPSWEIRGGKAI